MGLNAESAPSHWFTGASGKLIAANLTLKL